MVGSKPESLAAVLEAGCVPPFTYLANSQLVVGDRLVRVDRKHSAKGVPRPRRLPHGKQTVTQEHPNRYIGSVGNGGPQVIASIRETTELKQRQGEPEPKTRKLGLTRDN